MYIYKNRDIANLNQFQEDAIALNSKILAVLKFNEDELRFTLSEALTAPEEIELDAFVSAFEDNDPELTVPKIYAIAMAEAKTKHFHNIDYKMEVVSGLKLIHKRTVTKGEVTEVEWYKTLDAEQNPTDLVLRVNISYVRDASGFALYRTVVRTWINEDESENTETKISTKLYYVNPSDMIVEGDKRRKLLVQEIQIPVMNLIGEVLIPQGITLSNVIVKGRKFLDDYDGEFNKFKHHSSSITDPASPDFGMKSVRVKIRDEADATHVEWLDLYPNSLGGSTSIRDYLMEQFNI